MTLILILVLFFGLIFAGAPIAYAMIGTSIVYFLTGPIPSLVEVVPHKMFEGVDVIVLTAIPFFLLAGNLMNRSGMADRLMNFADLIVGWARGGLAQVNVLASLLFSGLTGVAVGDIAALGKLEVAAMEKNGYTRPFAAAVTVASALVGPIIPPSGVIIFYCAIMQVSVGAMFLAAIIPGLMLAGADMLLIYIMSRVRNFPVSKRERTVGKIARSSVDASLAILMPVFLIGGIVGGVMTPTEAAAATVVYAVIVSTVVYRALSVRDIWRILSNSAFESARLIFLIAGALTMTWIFALEDLSGLLSGIFLIFGDSQIGFILSVNVLFLILGMFMEPGLAVILFGPAIATIAYSFGITDVQLGIMLIVNVVVGLATPPIGNALFAIAAVTNVKTGAVVRELLPFLFAKIVIIVLIGMVPALTNAIPDYFGF